MARRERVGGLGAQERRREKERERALESRVGIILYFYRKVASGVCARLRVGGIVLPASLEASVLIGSEQAAHLRAGGSLDGVELRLEGLHDAVHPAVPGVEQRVQDRTLLGVMPMSS